MSDLSLEEIKRIENLNLIDLQAVRAVRQQLEMSEREAILTKHPYKISQGKDGLWRTYLPAKGEKRIQRKRNTKKEIEDVIVDYWKQEEDNPTIDDLFHEWNEHSLTLGNIVKATYDRNQKVFNRHYKEFGKRRIKSVSERDFADFLEAQASEHQLNAKAFASLKSITKGMLKRAQHRGLIDFSPTNLMGDLDISRKCFKKVEHKDCEEVFNAEETELMMQYLTDHQDIHNLGILLLFVTGLRRGELVALKWDCLSGNTVEVKRSETEYRDSSGKLQHVVQDHPKTEAGYRTVIIPDDYTWIIPALKKLNPDGKYVFMSNGHRLTGNAIYCRLRRVCKKLNIVPKSTHKIRRTYASILMDENVDYRMIEDQMGHTDIACTEQYYHKNRKDNDQKAKILNAVKEFKMTRSKCS